MDKSWIHESSELPPCDYWPESLVGTQKELAQWVFGEDCATPKWLRKQAEEGKIWLRRISYRQCELFFLNRRDHYSVLEIMRLLRLRQCVRKPVPGGCKVMPFAQFAEEQLNGRAESLGLDAEVIVIDSENEIFLPALGYGDDQKLAASFRVVWTSIPDADRKRIHGHWKSADAKKWLPPYTCSPLIQAVPDWLVGEYLRKARGFKLFAAVGRNGHHLHFWSHFVNAAPSNILTSLVAHELAHVLQTVGDDCSVCSSHHMGRNVDPVEIEADAIAAAWGFEQSCIDEFYQTLFKGSCYNA